MLQQFIRLFVLILLCATPLMGWTQTADLVMTADFYTVTNNLGRGNNLQGAATTNQSTFRWNGSRYVSTNTFTLPLRDRVWIKLDFLNRQMTHYLPVSNVVVNSDDEVQTYSDHRYLFYPGRDWNRGDRLLVHFTYQGYRYQAVLQINWLSAQQPVASNAVIPVVYSSVSRAAAPMYINPGWSVQIAAGRELPKADKYSKFSTYGNVYAVQDGRWYKVQIGSFTDEASALAVRNRVRRERGYSSAFVTGYNSEGTYPEWVAGTENRPANYEQVPPAASTEGYAVQIASLRQAPTSDKYAHLEGYRVYYRNEGSRYKVLVGPYPTMETASEVRRRLLRTHSSAFIKAEPGSGTQFLMDTSPRLYDDVTVRSPNRRIHEVQRGETLYRIAQRYGLTVDQLRARNNLPSNNRIYSGQQLYLN